MKMKQARITKAGSSVDKVDNAIHLELSSITNIISKPASTRHTRTGALNACFLELAQIEVYLRVNTS